MNWDDKMKELQAPFNWSDIKFRIGVKNSAKTSGLALAYVDNRAIQERFDKVFGIHGWKNEFKPWGDGQLCGISVWDDDKSCWITKWDGAENTKVEPLKGGLSDSQKRAAAQWGVGRYLYYLKQEWYEIKNDYGNVYSFVKRPTLPAWAYAQGELGQAHINALSKKVQAKGLKEENICGRFMKDEYSQLTIAEMQKAMEKLKNYEDVAEGEEPKPKDK